MKAGGPARLKTLSNGTLAPSLRMEPKSSGILAGLSARNLGVALLFWAVLALVAGPTATSAAVGGSSMPAAPHAIVALPVSTGSHLKVTEPASATTPTLGTAGVNLYAQDALYQAKIHAAQSQASAATPSASAAGAPHAAPLSGAAVTGWFSGYVSDSNGKAIQGASVQAYSEVGADCPNCTVVATNSTGGYTVICPVGLDYIHITHDWFVSADDYAVCVSAVNTPINKTVLTSEGSLTGVVEGSDSAHEKISGVVVTCSTLNNLFISTPSGVSNSNGVFNASLPPQPSRCDLTRSPGFGYFANFTVANTTPGVQVNIGVIYLERYTVVKVELVDAITNQSISGSLGSITMCSENGAGCLLQGASTTSSTIFGDSPTGEVYADVQVVGYVENKVPAGWVPREAPGHVFDLGKVYLLRMAALEVKTSITHAPGASAPWSIGNYFFTVATMNGYNAIQAKLNPTTGSYNTSAISTFTYTNNGNCPSPGWNSGTTALIPVFPLVSDIKIVPDTTPTCNGFSPEWPTPPDLPVWGNETWLNATPGSVDTITINWLNFTPGTYVSGSVFQANTSFAPAGGFTVSVASLDAPSINQYAFQTASFSDQPCGAYKNTSFCAPAPPGPTKLTVSSPVNSFPKNYTWGFTNYTCCSNYGGLPWGQTLPHYTPVNHFTSVNISSGFWVSGNVFKNGTTLGVPFGSIEVCPAGANSVTPCVGSAFGSSGVFSSPAPYGWDAITASASGYAPNTEWAYVTATKAPGTFAGNISMTSLGAVTGYVRSTNGSVIPFASVSICHVESGSCSALGAGGTGSSGQFLGLTTGGWLPWSTYEITAGASGFSSDFTFVNVSAGNVTWAPNITLVRAGVNTTVGALPAYSAASLASSGSNSSKSYVWVAGRIVDSETGWGVGQALVQACPLSGAPCVPVGSGANSGGVFLGDVPKGLYYLNVSATDYNPASVFFNATSSAFFNLSSIPLSPYAWVSGFALQNPWHLDYVKISTKVYTFTFGPTANVKGCDRSRSVCGVTTPVSTTGYYVAAVPGGTMNNIHIIPNAAPPTMSAAGGWNDNSSNLNITAGVFFTNETEPIFCDLFGSYSGYIRMSSPTVNVNGSLVPTLPARWVTISAQTNGTYPGFATGVANGYGYFDVFLPPGNGPRHSAISAQMQSIYTQESMLVPQNITPGGHFFAGNITLMHYGYAQLKVVSSANGLGVPYIGVAVATKDPLNHTVLTSTGAASDASGFVNTTAPYGKAGILSIAAQNDFNGTNTTLKQVNSSQTVFPNGTESPLSVGNLPAPAWGWIMSTDTNYTPSPVLITVIDKAKHLPLPQASISVQSSDTVTSGAATSGSNWAGQFVSDAPIGKQDQLVIAHSACARNNTRDIVKTGELISLRTVNITCNAILAGRVIANPSGLPIVGATVQACLQATTSCYSTTTNASGYFWVDAPPGIDVFSVNETGYVSNETALAQSCSDCWTWVGTIPLDEFAIVEGQVRGLPSGEPVDNATVSACSTLGTPVGVCGFSVQTNSKGIFLLPAPSGTYILQVNDTNFNSSYLPISLAPGETANVGVIFLEQFGTLVGTVLSGESFGAVPGALVTACPNWAGGGCTSVVKTDSAGHFALSGAPGPYVVSASASGYNDGYGDATIIAGGSATLQEILIYPVGSSAFIPVTGKVVNASDPAIGIPGAIVSAIVNATPSYSTVTDLTGAFSLPVLYGSYTLMVTSNGYAPSTQHLVVNAPVSGLLIPLSVMTFAITGIVDDSLTHIPLAGAELIEGGAVLSTSATDGSYSIALPNGTHNLTVACVACGNVPYPTVPFTLTVNGRSLTHDLSLSPPSTIVYGFVIDAQTGLSLAGVSVTLKGLADDNIPVSQSVVTNPDGQFTVTLPQGTYNGNASLSAYAPTTGSFLANSSAVSLRISMVSLESQKSVNTPVSQGSTGLLLAGGLVAAVGVAALLGGLFASGGSRRRSESSAAPLAKSPPKGEIKK
ncbi:MAG: carboxypeptidase regulatory-like domain-containing protein [Thermoplasmata archaeon]|nr:carboxypeptidase regulatory-like domain-containing protein [Thermoplasmata archaeon]